jgi:hypothetical protein
LAVIKEVVKRNLQEVVGFHKFSLKWVLNVLSAEQKAARIHMSRGLYNNLIFARQKNPATIITESWYYWSYTESSVWAQSRGDVRIRRLQKIDSKKSLFTKFFNGEKFAFLDSLPKGQNMDSYYFCNNVWKGSKPVPLLKQEKQL